jgi:Na+/H+ antiporter NhaC
MAEEYGISKRKTASLLDTFSCIFQGILPYGAQMLVALSAVATMGLELSAFKVIAHLFYPMMLLLSSLVFMFLIPDREERSTQK